MWKSKTTGTFCCMVGFFCFFFSRLGSFLIYNIWAAAGGGGSAGRGGGVAVLNTVFPELWMSQKSRTHSLPPPYINHQLWVCVLMSCACTAKSQTEERGREEVLLGESSHLSCHCSHMRSAAVFATTGFLMYGARQGGWHRWPKKTNKPSNSGKWKF